MRGCTYDVHPASLPGAFHSVRMPLGAAFEAFGMGVLGGIRRAKASNSQAKRASEAHFRFLRGASHVLVRGLSACYQATDTDAKLAREAP